MEESRNSSKETKQFVITRLLNAPRELVWQAFTDPDRMKQWWGPKGTKVLASTMNLRPGGTYHYGMRSPDGQDYWGRMVYKEIDPLRRLVFVNSFSDEKGGLARHPLSPSWPIEMLSTFTFEERGGKTLLTITWVPIDPTEEERTTFDSGRASMTNGWNGTFEKLESYLADETR